MLSTNTKDAFKKIVESIDKEAKPQVEVSVKGSKKGDANSGARLTKEHKVEEGKQGGKCPC